MPKNILKLSLIALSVLTLASCDSTKSFLNNGSQGTVSKAAPQSLASNSPFWQGNTATVWNNLQSVPLHKLKAAHFSDPTMAGWTQLAALSKQNSRSTTKLVQALIEWRAANPHHPGNDLFPNDSALNQLASSQVPQHIAILLPLTGPMGQQGKTVRSGFLSSYYANLSKTHIHQAVSFYDTSLSPDIGTLYQKALSDGADFVVGPLTKDTVQALTRQSNFSMPTLALNYTDVGFGSLPTNLYEFGLSPTDEAQQLADKARQAGRSHALIITTQNEWGQRVTKELTTRWNSDGGSVQDVLYITPQTDLTKEVAALLHLQPKLDHSKKEINDRASLEQGRRHDFDVIFLLIPPQTARQVVPLLRYYYVTNVPVYATSIIYSGRPSPERDMDINGVMFVDIPWVLHSHGKNSNRLVAVGTDAYTISNEIPRLTTLPNFPIYGATGAMSLNSKHQIFRRLPWTTIRNGQA
jgi:outer membrane PBP1 activator LpoA protein